MAEKEEEEEEEEEEEKEEVEVEEEEEGGGGQERVSVSFCYPSSFLCAYESEATGWSKKVAKILDNKKNY